LERIACGAVDQIGRGSQGQSESRVTGHGPTVAAKDAPALPALSTMSADPSPPGLWIMRMVAWAPAAYYLASRTREPDSQTNL
jgi:hypothetical protein